MDRRPCTNQGDRSTKGHRAEAVKNEHSLPEFIVADFHTALKSDKTPHYELVKGLGALTMKQIGKPSNLPGILEGCFGWLPAPYEPTVLKAMMKLQKKHELFARRAKRMLIDTTELTRGKGADECDRDGEYDEDEAEEVMRHFGGTRPPCDGENEADYLWDLTENLCKEWGGLSKEEEEKRMQHEKESAEAYDLAVEVIKEAIKENAEEEDSDEGDESDESEGSTDNEFQKPRHYSSREREEYEENARKSKRQRLRK